MVDKVIRLSKSCIGSAEKGAVMRVLDREYLGMGDEVRVFEAALSRFFDRPVRCVANGTAALQLAVEACGIGRGDEVLVPSLTYLASFQAISATGARPIACDVLEHDCLLDLDDAAKRMTTKTKAVMPVHYTGGVGDLAAVYQFAERYGLRVIEDAAHAFGSLCAGRRVGSFGDIACFSFDGIKNITSGEGGCIVTNDENVLRRVSDGRLLGVEKDTEKRYSGERSWSFDVAGQGWRFHMSNIMAAIGIEQLSRFDEFADKRRSFARQYDEVFADHDRIHALPRNYNEVVPHIFVVRVKGMIDREEKRARLLRKGIQTGVHYQPNHWLSFFQDDRQLPLSVTDALYPELLTLPLHADLSYDDVAYVAAELMKIV